MSFAAPSLPKKIQRDYLQSLRLEYDRSTISCNDSDKVFFVAPFAAPDDYTTLQHALVADFLRRLSCGKLKISINPILHQVQSSNPDIVRSSRQETLNALGKTLDKLAIVSGEISNTANVLNLQVIHDYTSQLFLEHQLAARRDVCYYNIYTSTAIPDHRVLYKSIDTIRYHIRFFFGSKNDTIVATLDDPCLLFGCVAILVHPQDKRYKKLWGKEVIIPLINKSIPIIAHESVKQEVHGTHLLIPAHNREDFSIALELGLPYDIYAIDKNGCFTEVAKDFKGKHRDEFRSNIIQFIDDIANLDRKEAVKILMPTDSLTGDSLLPLLQKNVYLSLSDYSLDDGCLVTSSVFSGLDSKLRSEIEKEEQWCISSYDFVQPYMPFDMQNEFKIESGSVWFRLVKDLYLLNIISFPAKGESIIQGRFFEINGIPLWKMLFECYFDFYTADDLLYVENLLVSLSSATNEDYVKILDTVLGILDSTIGIHYTVEGYVLDLQSLFRYDHEYLAVFLLLKEEDFSHVCILYNESQSHWVKHMLCLYNKIYKKKIPYSSFVSLATLSENVYVQTGIQAYPGDVGRMFLLSRIGLSGESDDLIDTQYSNDYIYRFLMKWRNAVRVIWGTSLSFDCLDMESVSSYLQQSEKDFSDYDVWIITKIRYVWEEFNYYSNKYSFAKAFQIVFDCLWYDIGEWTLFILKFAPSSQTKTIATIAAYISCHLLYPFAPTTVIGILSASKLQLRSKQINSLFAAMNLKKNYKCTLMMDAMMEWSRCVQARGSRYNLCIQTNKDFADYIVKQTDFIVTYFGGKETITLSIMPEIETLPEGWIGKDLLTMKVGIIVEKDDEFVMKGDDHQPVVRVSILQGQLTYKKQLLQTMRNTIMRMRSQSSHKESLLQLQGDTDTLQKEIEQIEYQISKMKYF